MAANGTTWKRGQTGNPGGRDNRYYGIKKLALKKCPAALKRLEEIMQQSDDLKAAYSACMGILAYGLGKPVQAIDISAKDGSLTELFRKAVRRANGMTPEAPEEPGVSGTTH